MAFECQGADGTQTLQSQRRIGQVDHANITLAATGNVLVKSGSGGEKTEKVEMSVSCKRDYDEKTLHLPDESDKSLRGIRYYHEASAVVKKGTASNQPSLRSERRLIGVEIAGSKLTPFCPKGPLSLDELELVIAAGDSLPIDELLPAQPVKSGDKWKAPDDAIALLLGLEEITTNSVEVVVKDITPTIARLQLEGKVEGKLYGAVNKISLEAKCRFDRARGRIDWFAMRVKQDREAGLVEDGLEVTLVVQMKIDPKETSEQLSDATLGNLPLKPTDELCKVLYERDEGGWQLAHDRSWFLIEHFRDLDVFHRLDKGQDLGMCKISPLPKADVEKLPNLAKFQSEIQQALGKNFGQFVVASESKNEAGYRVLRAVAAGTDGDVPVQWYYYHLSDAEGRQSSLVFRVEEKLLKAFGEADSQLVQSLRFVEKAKATK